MIARRQNGMAFLAGQWPLDPDRPTLVFIHGSGQQGSFWQAQVDGLAEAANTIAVDLPGHGNSEGDGFRTVTDYTRSVMGFIDAVNAPAPIPCGLSLGGAVALDLLIDQGHRLKAGILANTGARLKVLPIIIETIENNYADHLKGLIEFAVAPANQEDEEVCRKVLACSTAGPLVTANDFRACNAFDVIDQVSHIHVPVLVLSAVHDALTPVKYANWMAANIDGVRHITIDDAGHMSPIEQPDAFNAAILGFLGSLDR
ncbi:alpha/beta fold hydrolase [uncultured Desulfosarcina sp.]|uniref:alpha/beta fold hydrolase n=1 Tax=uncultured Desulfosarcina sp. TaxID=218289 RepID=UPI0029C70679|nr:alpha/beta fold hydrolase [uncultured Desulfosarcina sp.]